MSASNFPAGYDSLSDPTGADPLDSLTVPHADQHADANSAIEAIQATLGLNPQGSSGTVGARVGAIENVVAQATTQANNAAASAVQSESAANAAAQESYEAGLLADKALAAYQGRITGGSPLLSTPARLAEAEALLESAVWWIDAKEGGSAGQRVTNLGWGGSALNASLGSAAGGGLYVKRGPDGFLYLPGVANNYASVPDAANLDITGDIDIRVKVALDDWTPAADVALVTKYGSAGQRSFWFNLDAAGTLRLYWSADGTASASLASSVATGIADGATKWVRVTFDVDNGASGRTAKFYLSDDGVSWTQLGTDQTSATATSIFSSTARVVVGAVDAGTLPAAGKFYRAQVLNGIAGTTVLDVDFTNLANAGMRSFTASTGQVVTIADTGADSNDPKFLDWTGENYVYLPGVSGNYLSVPDEAALDITGDIDIRVRVALDDWTPAANSRLVSKYGGSDICYDLFLLNNGLLRLLWTTNGSTAITRDSTVVTGITDGTTKWVRATLDVDNGASGHDVKFWLSDDGVTWAQLGSTVTTAGTTSIFAGVAPVGIGATGNGVSPASGSFYRAIVKNGIDGPSVLDADCSLLTSGSATSFLARTGQTVSIVRGTSGRKAVAVTQPCWLFGTDDYMEVADNDLLDFGATDSFTAFAVGRMWATPTSSQALLAKRSASAATNAGWMLRTNTTVLAPQFNLNDGTINTNTTTATMSSGTLGAHAGVLDRTGQIARLYTNGVDSSAASSTAGVGSLENALALRVGRDGTTTYYADFEGIAFAVFRKALTQYEIELLNDYYQARDAGLDVQQPKKYVNMDALPVGAKGDMAFNEQSQQLLVKQGDNWNRVATQAGSLRSIPAGPSPAESLLKQAVWWIDANHASASGQTIRNLGWGGRVLDATAGSSGAVDSNDPRFLDFDGTPYCYIPGVANNFLSVPDADNLDITGDIDMIALVSFDTFSVQQRLVNKNGTSTSGGYGLTLLNTGFLYAGWSTGSAALGASATVSCAAAGMSLERAYWVRCTVDVDNGAGGYDVKFYFAPASADVPTVWTQIGATVTGAGATSIGANALAVGIGAWYTGADALSGRLYRAIVKNGINGTPVLDIDTSVLTSGSQSSFTALTGQRVSMGRASSGRKSTVVVAPCWLLGSDDYIEAPSSDLLNFGATDTFTVLLVNRQPSVTTSQVMISKRATAATGSAGWLLRNGTSGTTVGFLTSDGTTGGGAGTSASRAVGAMDVIAAVYPVATGAGVTYINGVAGAVGTTITGSLSNTLAMRVGSLVGGGTNADMELYAAAVFRRALTEAEIQTITDYYQGR